MMTKTTTKRRWICIVEFFLELGADGCHAKNRVLRVEQGRITTVATACPHLTAEAFKVFSTVVVMYAIVSLVWIRLQMVQLVFIKPVEDIFPMKTTACLMNKQNNNNDDDDSNEYNDWVVRVCNKELLKFRKNSV